MGSSNLPPGCTPGEIERQAEDPDEGLREELLAIVCDGADVRDEDALGERLVALVHRAEEAAARDALAELRTYRECAPNFVHADLRAGVDALHPGEVVAAVSCPLCAGGLEIQAGDEPEEVAVVGTPALEPPAGSSRPSRAACGREKPGRYCYAVDGDVALDTLGKCQACGWARLAVDQVESLRLAAAAAEEGGDPTTAALMRDAGAEVARGAAGAGDPEPGPRGRPAHPARRRGAPTARRRRARADPLRLGGPGRGLPDRDRRAARPLRGPGALRPPAPARPRAPPEPRPRRELRARGALAGPPDRRERGRPPRGLRRRAVRAGRGRRPGPRSGRFPASFSARSRRTSGTRPTRSRRAGSASSDSGA